MATPSTLRSGVQRWLEMVLPLYSIALAVAYFRPEYVPAVLHESLLDSALPWAIWGAIGAMGGVLALSGVLLAFFLLYSPVYLVARSLALVGKGRWVDRRELRFYIACFVLLCFLGGLAAWNPVAATVTFLLLAGCGHLFWRVLV